MNEPVSDCDRWHEPLSLWAAGCLPADEEAGLRRHVAGCGPCTARLADLAAVCARLARSRPPAAAHAAAIRERWQATGRAMTARTGTRWTRAPGSAAKLLGAAAALAAALLVCVGWLAGREPGAAPAPSARVVAAGGSQRAADEHGRRSDAPEAIAPVPRGGTAVTPPTLLHFRLALAKSDEAFEALLRRPGESMAHEPLDARSLLKECL